LRPMSAKATEPGLLSLAGSSICWRGGGARHLSLPPLGRNAPGQRTAGVSFMPQAVCRPAGGVQARYRRAGPCESIPKAPGHAGIFHHGALLLFSSNGAGQIIRAKPAPRLLAPEEAERRSSKRPGRSAPNSVWSRCCTIAEWPSYLAVMSWSVGAVSRQ